MNEDTSNLERTAGGVVIGDHGTIALIKSSNSQAWLFPKGHIDPSESEEEAARREIAEETGLIELELIDDLGEYSRPSGAGDDGTEYPGKSIRMFLFAAPHHAELAPSLEIEDAKWVSYREVADILGTPHEDWFAKDRAWFSTVFKRVKEAIERD
jgi:8-oxo-dGTP pyrophosphatase MutT (NUDIX family)